MGVSDKLGRQAKAIAAALYIVGVNLLAFVTGDETLADVTTNEWIFVAVEVLGSYGIVYGVANKT